MPPPPTAGGNLKNMRVFFQFNVKNRASHGTNPITVPPWDIYPSGQLISNRGIALGGNCPTEVMVLGGSCPGGYLLKG